MENATNVKSDYIVSSLEEFFGDYTVATVDEYFELLDKETQKRSQMVAKSLTQYLKNVKASTKYDNLRKVTL